MRISLEPGTTTGRLVSVCGAMGVIVSPSTRGCRMGPPAERLYAVVPVGLAMMRPSALTRIMNSPSTETDSSMMRESAPCVTTTSLSTTRSTSRRAPGVDANVQHHALFDLRRAVHGGFQRRKDLRQRHLGQESQAAEIDAEDRDVRLGLRDAAGRAEQRAVAAQDDDHLDHAGKLILSSDVVPRRRAGRAGERGRVRVEHRLNVPRLEPRRDLRQMARGTLEPRLGDDAYASHEPWPLRCRKNSRLPVSPVMGDSVMAARTNPTSAAARGRLLDHPCLHDRIADHALLADFSAARLELRFDERDDVGARSQQRRHAGKDVTQGDERDIDRDDVDRAWEMRRLERAGVRALDDHHAGIVAQTPVELAVTDVEGHHARRASLQQHVGETAGGRADIERLPAVQREWRRRPARAPV